jgi:hypothetical protein
MTNGLTDDIPIGDIQFYDNYTPALTAGVWKIEVDQTLVQNEQTINTDSLTSTQEFAVSAPQFAIDTNQIVTAYPPQGSTGQYGQVLPHIVLNDPLLPWERKMQDPANVEPWLALLVFADGELLGGDPTSITQTTITTVGDFIQSDNNVLKPNIVPEADVSNDDPCTYIQVPVALFQAITPRLQELRYLTHCRQVNTGDKAMLGLNEDGLFSVVVANRFPALPANATDPPAKNIVHLVSVEGLDNYLTATANFGAYTSVAMLSFSSWTFFSQSDNQEDFRGLMNNLISSETNAGSLDPNLLWLSLPTQKNLNANDPNQAEVLKRIGDGFVPIEYHTRTGEDTFAWYRGPLTPLLSSALDKPADQQGPFMTADSALIYQSSFGMFDSSLAAAWEIGRALAISDKAFGKTLLAFRSRANALIDQLLNRLQSDSFSQSQISELDTDTSVQDEFLQILNEQLLFDIGQGPNPNSSSNSTPTTQPPDTDPQVALQNFLADPAVQQLIISAVQNDLDPISQWLAKLVLLYPVPFNYLVSDERMLPLESLRFFYLDNNWLGALLDGAQSIGMESSRQTFLFELTYDLITDSAFAAASVYRSQLLGTEPPASETQLSIMSGFLLRSALVSGWPNIAIRPFLNSGEMLKILRLDLLSPTVMLCIFWGVPDYIEFSEPQESLRFGVDDGNIALRNLIPSTGANDPVLGAQLTSAQPFPVFDLSGQAALYMRAAGSRVLNLDPTSSTALIPQLQIALAKALNQSLPILGPADFAIQMVKAPEAIDFNCLSRTG